MAVPDDGVIELVDLVEAPERYARKLDAAGGIQPLQVRPGRRRFNGKRKFEMVQRSVQPERHAPKRLHSRFRLRGESGAGGSRQIGSGAGGERVRKLGERT